MEQSVEPQKKGIFSFKKRKSKKERIIEGQIQNCEYLMQFKPREKIVFHSDYFKIDDMYCTIMMFNHPEGVDDNFCPFWPIMLIPLGLDRSVETINFESVSRMKKSWVQENQQKTERFYDVEGQEISKGKSMMNALSHKKKREDLIKISDELRNGASYLNVHYRLMVKAPSLELLDASRIKIEESYKSKLGEIYPAAYIGDQRKELSDLFAPNKRKNGDGYYYTSVEYAAAYSLVTHGLEDPHGVYVGQMKETDVNNSCVIFDVDGFAHHSMVCFEQTKLNDRRETISCTDEWLMKISQEALKAGHRVVHIVLNNCKIQSMGASLENITAYINMNHGDVNPMEVFGEAKDSLSLMQPHANKLCLMLSQIYPMEKETEASVHSTFSGIIQDFYADQRMWRMDAQNNVDKLRIVGIPHWEVPILEEFRLYVKQKRASQEAKSDNWMSRDLRVIEQALVKMIDLNGDLFNVRTKNSIDDATCSQRVVYDFSEMSTKRDNGIAMAQLVNVLSFALGMLEEDDVLIIHGAERIEEGVKNYVDTQIKNFFGKNGRVVYGYNDVERMMNDKEFSKFDTAYYMILGMMTNNQITRFEKEIGQRMPKELKKSLSSRNSGNVYIRRGFDNVVFTPDIRLNILDTKSRKRRLYLN